MSAKPKIAPPRTKKKPRRYHPVDVEPLSAAVVENPDWLVGAY